MSFPTPTAAGQEYIDSVLGKYISVELTAGNFIWNKVSSSVETTIDNSGTEVASGGQITFTVGQTTFNVSSTLGQIKTSAGYSKIDFLGQAGISLVNTVASSTWVYIDSNGLLGQQTTTPTPKEYREKLYLTRLAVDNGVLIGQESAINPLGQYVNTFRDYFRFIKSPKIGLELSPNSDLTFQVSAGSIFELGTNVVNDIDDPNTITFLNQNPATFFYINQIGTISSGQTIVNVTDYDVNGTQTTMTNNRFKIMSVYKFNSGNHAIQEGQSQYSSLDNAQNSISNGIFIQNPAVINGTRIGWIIVKKNTTDLSNPEDARFINDLGTSATSISSVGSLIASNNLSDLENAEVARANIGALSPTNITSGSIIAASGTVNMGLIATAVQPSQLALISKRYITVALSGDGQPITVGLSKGSCRIPINGLITGVTIDCDPADEPLAINVQVDCNKVDRTTGVRSSILDTIASISTNENTGMGTIKTDGTENVLAGDLLIFDVDQGSDGGLLTVTIEITPA